MVTQSTAEDLEATKLSLINSVVTTYYQIAYLNDASTPHKKALNTTTTLAALCNVVYHKVLRTAQV